MTDTRSDAGADTSVDIRTVAAAIVNSAQQRHVDESTAKAPIGHHLLRLTQELRWLLGDDGEARSPRAKKAAMQIAAGALSGIREHDPRFQHESSKRLVEWLIKIMLDPGPLSQPASDEDLRAQALMIVRDVSVAAAHENARRGRASGDAEQAIERADPVKRLRKVLVSSARYFASNWTDGSTPTPELPSEPVSSPVVVADPSTELSVLQERRHALVGRVDAARTALDVDGRPLDEQLLTELRLFGQDVARLSRVVEAPASIAALETALAARDPRRAALQALARLLVDGSDLAAAQDVRERATAALAAFEEGTETDDLVALLWLHDWIAFNGGLLSEQPDPNAVMGHLLGAQMQVAIAVPPIIELVTFDLAPGQVSRAARPGAGDFSASGSEPDGATASEPKPDQPGTLVEAETANDEPGPEPEATDIDIKPATEPESEPEAEPEPVPEAEFEAELEPEARPELEPEPEAEAALSSHLDPESQLEREPEPEPAPESKPEFAPEPEPEPEPDTADADAVRLIDAGLPGVAALQPTIGPMESASLDALALTGPARAPSTARDVEFRRFVADFKPQGSTGEAAVIAFAAALNAIAWGPAGPGMEVLDRLDSVVAEHPGLQDIAQRVRLTAQQGVDLNRVVLPSREHEQLQQRFDELAANARELLRRPGKLNFQRGTRLWQRWIDPRRGRVGCLLSAIAEPEPARFAAVTTEASELRGHLDAVLDRDDQALRGHGSDALKGKARRDIISRTGEALAIVEEALEIHRELSTDKPENRHAQALIVKLQDTLSARGNAAQSEINDDLPLGQAAVGLVVRTLCNTIVDGRFPDDVPQSPWLAQRGALLGLPDVDMGDELQPLRPLTEQDTTTLLETEPSWDEAFDQRLKRGELRAAKLLTQWRWPDDEARMTAISTAGARLTDEHLTQILAIRTEVDADWQRGCLAPEAVAGFHQELDRIADEAATTPDITLSRTLVAKQNELRRVAAAYRERRKTELRGRMAAGGYDDVDRTLVEDSLAHGDIATAEDQLERLSAARRYERNGHIDPLTHLKVFNEVTKALRGLEVVTRPMVEAALRGDKQLVAGLDFAPVRAIDAEPAALGALAQWFEIRDDGSLHRSPKERLRQHLQAVLHAIGVEVEKLSHRGGLHTAHGVGVVDYELQGTLRGGAIVPQYGSEARAYRVALLIDTGSSPNDLLSAARGGSDLPCIAFTTSRPLSMTQRRRIARLHREDPTAPPVLFIDLAVFLYVLSLGVSEARPMLEVTLPFTAINPYLPYRAGDVPEEMFFGRNDELQGLIASKDGISLVYGGRRLGKSALLDEAKRRADRRSDGRRTLYLDLKTSGIGEWNPPSALVPLLIERLVHELPMSAQRGKLSDTTRLQRIIATWLRARRAPPHRRVPRRGRRVPAQRRRRRVRDSEPALQAAERSR